MGSPSRNVQYHPPRLSEDRLNLPQPHSPSLPTHCSGKSGMRPPAGSSVTASLQGIESRHVRRADHRPELRQDRRLETQGPCPTARRMLLTALGSVSLLNQLSTRLGHEAPVGCGAPASTRPSSTRSGNAKSFLGHTPPAAPVAGQPQPGAVHRAAQRLLRPAGPRVRRRWPCRLTLRQPPWADPYARCCGRAEPRGSPYPDLRFGPGG